MHRLVANLSLPGSNDCPGSPWQGGRKGCMRESCHPKFQSALRVLTVGNSISDFWGVLLLSWGGLTAFSQLYPDGEGMHITCTWAADLQPPSTDSRGRHWKPMVVPERPGQSYSPKTIGPSASPDSLAPFRWRRTQDNGCRSPFGDRRGCESEYG